MTNSRLSTKSCPCRVFPAIVSFTSGYISRRWCAGAHSSVLPHDAKLFFPYGLFCSREPARKQSGGRLKSKMNHSKKKLVPGVRVEPTRPV